MSSNEAGDNFVAAAGASIRHGPSTPDHATRGYFRAAIWAALIAVGLAAWLPTLGGETAARAWRGLLVNFLFFGPLGAGLVLWSAIVLVSRGRWSGRLENLTLAGLATAPLALVMLAALWITSAAWAPWATAKDLPQGFWLNPTFVFGRDLAGLAIFWIMAWAYARQRLAGRGGVLGGWLIFVYVIALSFVAYDLVAALDVKWYSTLWGLYFAVTGVYSGVALWALMAACVGGVARDKLHDIGKLLVAFSLLTTYMMFSQLLPIWYANLPEEVRMPLARMNYPAWRVVSTVLLATMYLGPLALLLTIRAKRTPWVLGTVAGLVLVSLWVGRWWSVAPTFSHEIEFGGPEIGITLAGLGAFGLSLDVGRGWAEKQRISDIEQGM